jgi:1-acyl-sn-glycerol-3-phosphate acyltransferase
MDPSHQENRTRGATLPIPRQRRDNASVKGSALARRLLIEPGQHVLVMNAPAGYMNLLQPLPDGASAIEQGNGPRDVVQLFSRDRAELESHAQAALHAVKPGGVLWMSYPSPSSGPSSDLMRDHGWGVLHAAGLVAVTHVEVDEQWMAIRFRPAAEAAGDGVVEAPIPPADLLPVGRKATLAYRLVRLVAIPALRLAFNFRISGRERIPRTGTYVVIGNHLGWLDALTFLVVFPIEPRIHFLADPTGMMRRRLEWALIKATGGVVPVDRALRHDPRLFRHVFRCLELGGAIALFPEGDIGPREGEIQPFKKGFAHFAVEGGVRVVPVALSGTKDLWLRKKIEVFIGEPISPGGKSVEEVLGLGAEAVRNLLPPYAEPPGRKPLRRWLTGLF